MSWLAPWLFGAGIAAALGVVALHLLTTRRPPPAPLPTARFVPDSEVRAVSRARRPTDLLLLALRVLAVLAIGAAFGQPVLDAPGPRVRTIYAVEHTGSVAELPTAFVAVRQDWQEGDALIEFNLNAMELDPRIEAEDSPFEPPAMAVLSPVFVRAREVAARLARGADSVRLVLVSPLMEGAFDASTAAMRATWPGRVELMRARPVLDTARGPRAELFTALADDPLAPALARARVNRGAHEIRVYRAPGHRADTTWLLAAPNRVALEWAPLDTAVEADAVTAFSANGPATIVAPLARVAMWTGGRVVARWRDGSPAVVERGLGQSCVRAVAISLPTAGDLTLRPPFADFLDVLLEPCRGAHSRPLSDSLTAAFLGAGPLASADALAGMAEGDSTIPMVLLALALAALAAEQWLRRRPAGGKVA